MNSEEIKVLLKSTRKANVVPLVWGDSGIGKSQTVKQFADENNLQFIDLRLGQMETGDLVGLPAREGDRTIWLKPEWFPTEGEGVLFLDEINGKSI